VSAQLPCLFTFIAKWFLLLLTDIDTLQAGVSHLKQPRKLSPLKGWPRLNLARMGQHSKKRIWTFPKIVTTQSSHSLQNWGHFSTWNLCLPIMSWIKINHPKPLASSCSLSHSSWKMLVKRMQERADTHPSRQKSWKPAEIDKQSKSTPIYGWTKVDLNTHTYILTGIIKAEVSIQINWKTDSRNSTKSCPN